MAYRVWLLLYMQPVPCATYYLYAPYCVACP